MGGAPPFLQGKLTDADAWWNAKTHQGSGDGHMVLAPPLADGAADESSTSIAMSS